MLNKTKIIAYRGLCSTPDALENTREAFLLAVKKNFDGIETDIWMTKDNQIVCAHDPDLFIKRQEKIYELNYSEIANEKIRPSKNFPFYSPGLFDYDKKNHNYHVCLFSDFLKIIVDNNMIAFIELKVNHEFKWDDCRIECLFNQIADSKINVNQFYLISFDQELLKKIKQLKPQFNVLMMFNQKQQNNVEQYINNKQSINIGDYDSIKNFECSFKIDEQLINKFHEHNLLVGCWTVDDINRVKKLIDLEVDFITTNYAFYWQLRYLWS